MSISGCGYNYSKLLGRMREQGKTQENVARAVHLNASTLNLKLNNRREFTQSEIRNICEFLGIEAEEISAYFFTHYLWIS